MFSVAKATLQLQMSVCLSVHWQNPFILPCSNKDDGEIGGMVVRMMVVMMGRKVMVIRMVRSQVTNTSLTVLYFICYKRMVSSESKYRYTIFPNYMAKWLIC